MKNINDARLKCPNCHGILKLDPRGRTLRNEEIDDDLDGDDDFDEGYDLDEGDDFDEGYDFDD